MIESGNIHLADLNQEHRIPVLVVSTGRFTRLSGRALVAPAIPAERLVEFTGRVTPTVAASVQRVIRHIT